MCPGGAAEEHQSAAEPHEAQRNGERNGEHQPEAEADSIETQHLHQITNAHDQRPFMAAAPECQYDQHGREARGLHEGGGTDALMDLNAHPANNILTEVVLEHPPKRDRERGEQGEDGEDPGSKRQRPAMRLRDHLDGPALTEIRVDDQCTGADDVQRDLHEARLTHVAGDRGSRDSGGESCSGVKSSGSHHQHVNPLDDPEGSDEEEDLDAEWAQGEQQNGDAFMSPPEGLHQQDGESAEREPLPPQPPLPHPRHRHPHNGEGMEDSEPKRRRFSRKTEDTQHHPYAGKLVHRSHQPGHCKGYLFCWICGSWCAADPKSLKAPCPKIPTKSGAEAIARLTSGRLPHYSLKHWPAPLSDPPTSVPIRTNPFGGYHRPKVLVQHSVK